MPSREDLAPGTRVRLIAPSPLLTLDSNGGDTGTIVEHTGELDYYVVRLDKPAQYHGNQYHGNTNGTVELLDEIVEDRDNMDVLT